MNYMILTTIATLAMCLHNQKIIAADGTDETDLSTRSRTSSTSSDSSAGTADLDTDLSTPAGQARQDARAIYNRTFNIKTDHERSRYLAEIQELEDTLTIIYTNLRPDQRPDTKRACATFEQELAIAPDAPTRLSLIEKLGVSILADDGLTDRQQADHYALQIQGHMSQQPSITVADELTQALLLLNIRGTNLDSVIESMAAALDAAKDEAAQRAYIRTLTVLQTAEES